MQLQADQQESCKYYTGGREMTSRQIYKRWTLVRYPLNNSQNAYLAGKSTETALHNLVQRIERAINNKEYALGVFLDIEAAFNNASSTSLLSIM